jgi:hypothetical protein
MDRSNRPPSSNRSKRIKLFLLPLFALILISLLVLSLFHSGGQQPSVVPTPQVDFNKAKTVSDAVPDDLAKGNTKDLLGRLDLGFHMMVKDEGDLRKVMEKMDGTYGRPVQWVFKVSNPGIRQDGNWKRASQTFYYAVKTTQYPMGKYFLKVEVVTAFSGGFLDVSGFGYFTFKDGQVPDYLK